jgi:hypothetical protein
MELRKGTRELRKLHSEELHRLFTSRRVGLEGLV